jgi:hypothetical protein
MTEAETSMALHIKRAREEIQEALACAGAHALDAWKPNLRIADSALEDIEERLSE